MQFASKPLNSAHMVGFCSGVLSVVTGKQQPEQSCWFCTAATVAKQLTNEQLMNAFHSHVTYVTSGVEAGRTGLYYK